MARRIVALARMNPLDRFLRHVQKTETCWLWTGAKSHSGYGVFGWGGKGGKQSSAHRFIFEHYNGPLTRDIVVCHTCDVKTCVRPDHLFAGTQADNLEDMRRKGRRKRTGPAGGQLTDIDIPVIRSLYAAGLSQAAIAKRYGVNQTTISRVILRQIWQHIP
jgi:hypothetical protein